MTETQVGFLYKAASSLHSAGDNKTLTLLRSYYLMRCKNITKGYGLPEKCFSSKVRCSKCCIEWSNDAEVKVKAIKLSRKQRQRIRSQKSKKNNKEIIEKRKQLLNSNEIEQICSFCKKSTITTAPKPDNLKILVTPSNHKLTRDVSASANKETPLMNSKKGQSNKIISTSNAKKPEQAKMKKSNDKKTKNKMNEVNVYSITKSVFSLNNKKNVLPSSKKEEQKIIKNNKKKKDKFAGLCERAVLATAKMKEQKDKQNKLNLFLKPST